MARLAVTQLSMLLILGMLGSAYAWWFTDPNPEDCQNLQIAKILELQFGVATFPNGTRVTNYRLPKPGEVIGGAGPTLLLNGHNHTFQLILQAPKIKGAQVWVEVGGTVGIGSNDCVDIPSSSDPSLLSDFPTPEGYVTWVYTAASVFGIQTSSEDHMKAIKDFHTMMNKTDGGALDFWQDEGHWAHASIKFSPPTSPYVGELDESQKQPPNGTSENMIFTMSRMGFFTVDKLRCSNTTVEECSAMCRSELNDANVVCEIRDSTDEFCRPRCACGPDSKYDPTTQGCSPYPRQICDADCNKQLGGRGGRCAPNDNSKCMCAKDFTMYRLNHISSVCILSE